MSKFECGEQPLPVDGTFPEWIEGTLYRGGPGSFSVERENGGTKYYSHWFDGLSVMNSFKIHEGKVTYRRTDHAQKVRKYIAAHGTSLIQFGEDPCFSTFRSIQSVFSLSPIDYRDPDTNEMLRNVNVTIKKIGGKLYSMTDSPNAYVFDSESLERFPVETMDVAFDNPKLKGSLSASHGHHDPHTKEYINFIYDFKSGLYTIFKIKDVENQGKGEEEEEKGASGEPIIIGSVRAKPSYLHSTCLTENFFILVLWPMAINPLKLLWSQSVVGSMTWSPSRQTEIYVISRETGNVQATFTTEPFFCFHTINAYEMPMTKEISIHLISYPDGDVIDGLRLDNLREGKNPPLGHVSRIVLPCPTRSDLSPKMSVPFETISDVGIELPRIDPRLSTKNFNFVYGVSCENHGFDSIVKLNVKTGEVVRWSGQDVYFPGEPIFLPSPSSTEEDEGVVLTIVLDTVHKNSFLLCLNAVDLTEIGRASCFDHISFGFHGNFYGSSMNTDLS
eukprot:CAMPEP_0201492540 /NCGR_PEP_ID=MMETSP0151_2-20130828/33565_1 /ASSEMBLY_ACC=CAM_ASM_000257 /TAXON_ID=200890 /ORGANISM="Paramoeba atlantica, Strain 621/1 / CCAP 1560/9" /LENGTH=502 /DNA_ID=CAMNT_0047879405 /DNA_START=396 /DNA_END=1904 /DNA_ORIENTATION=-